MNELHLHIHVPPGTELVFDGETLTCRPVAGLVASKLDPQAIPLTTEEMAALLKEPNVDSG